MVLFLDWPQNVSKPLGVLANPCLILVVEETQRAEQAEVDAVQSEAAVIEAQQAVENITAVLDQTNGQVGCSL